MPEVIVAVLGGSVGAAIIAGVFNLIEKKVDRRNEIKDRAEEKADKDSDQSEAILEIQHSLENIDTKLDNLTEGTMATLGDRLKDSANRYINEGSITTADLDDWLRLHAIYHEKLKGNGYLDTLKEKIKQLPIKKGK